MLGGVVGHEPLQQLRHVEDEPDGERDHRDAGGDAEAALVRAERLDALDEPAAGEREEQQRDRDADRERDREQDRVDADAPGRSGDDDRGEHRPGARHEDGAEREPDAVAAPLVRHLGAPGEPLERLLEQLLEARHEQADADQHEHGDARPSGGCPAAG